jgi:hypothetical protein
MPNVARINFPSLPREVASALARIARAISGEVDFEFLDSEKGIIIPSPDGTRWRITVDNAGSLVTTAVP